MIDASRLRSTLLLLVLAGAAACRAALVESLTDDEETVEALMEIVNATFGR